MRTHAQRIARLVLVCCALGAVSAVLSATPAAAERGDDTTSRPVVLIMAEHVDWATAPAELDGWARASSAMHSAGWEQTSNDGWLTLGKGRRAIAFWPIGDLPAPAPGAGEISFQFPGWDRIVSNDDATHYGGRVGEFGEALERSGRRWQLVSQDPTAALATVDRSGMVRHFVWGGPSEVRAAVAAGTDVVIANSDGTSELPRFIDAAGDGCVMVATVSSPFDAVHLGMFAASPACGLGTDGLVSPSTRQFPFVTLVDVAPTVLDRAGIPAVASMVGLPVTPDAAIDTRDLVSEDLRARRVDEHRVDFAWWFVAMAALGSLLVLVRRHATLPVVLVWSALPVSTFLIMLFPWPAWGWWGAPLLATAIAGTLAGAAHVTWGRRDPMAAILALAVVTVVVLIGDAVRGGTLELDAPFGNSPIIAGRFAGLGNIAFGFSMGALLVACAIAMHRWGHRARLWVVVACVAFAIAGAPPLGDKVGLVPVWVPASGVLLVSLLRGRVRPTRFALLALGGFAVLAAFAAFDLLHSDASQSHLARWLTSGDSFDTIVRKLNSMARTFRDGPLRFVLPGPLIVLWLERRRLLGAAWLRSLVTALATATVLGTLLNDSGLEVAMAVVVGSWPALVHLAQTESGVDRTPSVAVEPVEPVGPQAATARRATFAAGGAASRSGSASS